MSPLGNPPFRIKFSVRDGCYRIWQRAADWDSYGRFLAGDPTATEYACLRWMQFVTVEAAEQYLATHEVPAYYTRSKPPFKRAAG